MNRRFLPSLSALQAFEAAVRHSNFTRAAGELGLTQSAVSRHVSGLEQFLGLPLFERAGPNLVVSEMGSAYYADVVQILARLEEVSIDAVRGSRTDEALVIGSTPTLAEAWLIPRMQDFARDHPAALFELAIIDNNEDLETSRVDVAVMRGAGQWRARAHRLFDEELIVVCSPDLSKDRPVDLSHLPLLQNASRPSLWLTWMRLSGIQYRGTIQGNRFSHTALVIKAALLGMGLAVVPAHYVKRELAEGRLVPPFSGAIPSGETIWMVVPDRKSQKKHIKLFLDWMLPLQRKGYFGS